MEEPQELDDHQKYCFKCKKVVDLEDFNIYYGICHCCVSKSNGH